MEGTLPNSSYKFSISLIPKVDEDIKKNYRSTPSMNIDAKILNKILASQIQKDLESVI
jgi:hypothetical protein